jgi:hypothetical protein
MRLLAAPLAAFVVAAAAVRPQPSSPAPQSDLDALMQKVLARRDENWKKLQQYVLEEHARIDVRGASSNRIWGERREYLWYPRDGFFIRSPLKVNGVTVSEPDRRRAEDGYLHWVRTRDQPDPKSPETRSSVSIGTDGIRFSPGMSTLPGDDSPADPSSLIRQRRQPEFIEAAYVLRLSFDGGRYAFVGRERLENLDVLRIEYYPKRLYKGDDNSDPKIPMRERQQDELMAQILNKAALVTLWVAPRANQIVRYTFDNVSLDVFPAAWLVRPTALKASMTMTQAFKDVWLPRDVDIDVAAMFATGPIDVKYRIEYRDYREAITDARIKR